MKTLALMVSNSTHEPQPNKAHLNQIPPPSNSHLLYIQMNMVRRNHCFMSVLMISLCVDSFSNKQEPKHSYESSYIHSYTVRWKNQWWSEHNKVSRWKKTERQLSCDDVSIDFSSFSICNMRILLSKSKQCIGYMVR